MDGSLLVSLEVSIQCCFLSTYLSFEEMKIILAELSDSLEQVVWIRVITTLVEVDILVF
jgi:hypothetical protein